MVAFYHRLRSIGDQPWLASLLLLLLAVAVIFPNLGVSGLDEYDESLYASVARELWRTGDLVHLRVGDQPYLNKPPLFMALTALSYEWFGVSEFSARFMAAALGVGHALLGFWVMRSLFGGGRAFVAMLLLLAHYHFLGVARAGRMESLVSLCLLAGFGALLKCRTDGRWWPVVGLTVGLGVLAKGPMGLMLLVIAMPCLALDPALRQSITWRRGLAAVAVACAVILPWYAAEVAAYGARFLHVFMGQQVLDRVASNLHGRDQPMWYFLHRITGHDFGTWSPLAPLALAFVALRAWRWRSVKYVYLASYALVLLFVFSVLVQTKLHQYIFSIYVPLAMCVALLIERMGRRWAAVPGVFAFLALVTALIYPWVDRPRHLSLQALAPALHHVAESGGELIVAGVNPQGAIFYGDMPVGSVPDPQSLADRARTTCLYGLTPAGKYGSWVDPPAGLSVLARTTEHVLFASAPCRNDARMAAVAQH